MADAELQNDLVRVAQDYVALLRLLEERGLGLGSDSIAAASSLHGSGGGGGGGRPGSAAFQQLSAPSVFPHSSSFQNAFFMNRVGLTCEEAQAVNCLEFRDGLVVRYLDNKTVVTGGSFAIIYEKAKIYSSSNTVVDELLISNIKEMYHDEVEGCLRLDCLSVGVVEVHCPKAATLRSMYYNLLIRHPDYTTASFHTDPLRHAENLLLRADGAGLTRGATAPAAGPPPQTQLDAVSASALSQQQAQIDTLTRSVQDLRASSPPYPYHASSPPRQQQPHPVTLPHKEGAVVAAQREHGKGHAYLHLGKRPSITGSRRAVLISCEYSGTLNALPGSASRANAVSDFLSARGFGGEKIVLSDADTRALPTKHNVLKAMRWLVDGSGPGDSLFLCFVGHGGQMPGPGHGAQEGLCPCDYHTAGVVTGDEVRTALRVPGGVRLTVVSDLSGGGGIVALPWSVVGSNPMRVLDGGAMAANSPFNAGLTLQVSSLKDTAGGGESVALAYCKAMNYLPEPTAAQMLSATCQAMQQRVATTPVLSSYRPIPCNFNASLGSHLTEFVTAEGADMQALQAYHKEEAGSWVPPYALDTFY